MDKRFPGWSNSLNFADYGDNLFQRELTIGNPTNKYDYDPLLRHTAYKKKLQEMTSMRNAVQKYSGVNMGGF